MHIAQATPIRLYLLQLALVEDGMPIPVEDFAGEMDVVGAYMSIRKLASLAKNEGVTLVIFGHDAQQWKTLKKAPEFYS